MKLAKPLVLTGMMGSGKTSIGKVLAQRLQVPFYDLDEEIEREQKATVRDIFSKYGEGVFRRIEKQKLQNLLLKGPQVIATGGGAVIDEGTRSLLHECAIPVWLKADVEVLEKRVAGDDTRPLLAGDDPKKVLRRILEQRTPYYAQAPIVLVNNGNNVEAAADELMAMLGNYIR
ncbi:MAG TPA: shikimate kinase [Alphaproteobacteria bacterium]|nr:shikimate kinase [Alphaproteobacteria bacterium]